MVRTCTAHVQYTTTVRCACHVSLRTSGLNKYKCQIIILEAYFNRTLTKPTEQQPPLKVRYRAPFTRYPITLQGTVHQIPSHAIGHSSLDTHSRYRALFTRYPITLQGTVHQIPSHAIGHSSLDTQSRYRAQFTRQPVTL